MQSRHHYLLIAVVGFFALQGSSCTKPSAPVVEYVYVTKYVSVEDALTQEHPIAEGPLSHCPAVANARKVELQKCNADKAAIRTIEGTDVPQEDKP
jgi:hypothetical protein